eukprot:2456611-Ditylum_brightwellii.AAC.1
MAHVDNIYAVNINNFDAAFPGVTAHTGSDVDLLLDIWWLKAEEIDLQTEWVEAHQYTNYLDRELSEPANLNCTVNTDVTAYMASPLYTQSIIPPVLPSSCAILIMGDIVVTSKMKEVLHNVANCSDIQEYVERKTEWQWNLFNAVQWPALEAAFLNLTLLNKV